MKIGDYEPKQIRKALSAFPIGLLGAIGTALLDGDLTQGEVLASIGTGLLASITVFQIKNKDVETAQ